MLFGQAMTGRQSHHQLHFSHRFELDGRIQFDDRQGNESHVNPPIHQSRNLFVRRQIQDGQVHDGKAFAKRADGWRQEQATNRRKNRETKLTMPVLTVGGEKANGALLGEQTKIASDVMVIVLENTGHWVLEERPKETTDALMKFL